MKIKSGRLSKLVHQRIRVLRAAYTRPKHRMGRVQDRGPSLSDLAAGKIPCSGSTSESASPAKFSRDNCQYRSRYRELFVDASGAKWRNGIACQCDLRIRS